MNNWNNEDLDATFTLMQAHVITGLKVDDSDNLNERFSVMTLDFKSIDK